MKQDLTHISLCTGIGGFDEAAETVGFTNLANCEIDATCRLYLNNRFPNTKQYTNVINDPPSEHATVLSFGFPCQDISNCGKGAGIFGERSKIFFNCMDVARAVKPKYIVIENSTTLLKRGMGNVLSQISKQGYDAEWVCLSGAQFGYPQQRKRLFIVAHTMRQRCRNAILQPPGTFAISQPWAPTETFVHVSTSRANGYANITAICRGDVVPYNNFWLHAIGNAVMPVCAEHIFNCIKFHHQTK